MTNKTKIYIGIGSAVALIGGYFIYKALRPKKPMVNGTKDDTKPKTDVSTTTTTTTPIVTPTTTTTPKKDEEPDNYQWKGQKKYVVTASPYLFIRSEPNINSQKIGRLSKGCEIRASPTSTSGWLDMNYNFYSTDKCFYDMGLVKTSFYVSSQYLKEIK